MVQLWREPDEDYDAVDLVPTGQVPDGWCRVFDGVDGRDREVSLIHEDTEALRRIAVFDAVVNNADRKGGHVLAMSTGHRYGVDHGLTFHTEDKLRTVLWGWRGEPLTGEEQRGLQGVRDELDRGLGTVLRDLVTATELEALAARCDQFLRQGRLPGPPSGWPAIPWPPF